MSALSLEISEGQLKDAIAVALVEAFSPEKRDALMRDVVRAHLAYKTNSWDKQTLLGVAVGKMIRKVATEEMNKRLEEMRPRIAEMVRGALGSKFEASVFLSLTGALQSVAIRNIRVVAEMDEG